MVKKHKLMEVMNFISKYNEENGYSPTVRDICAALNIPSTATVYTYINRLCEMGLLKKAGNKNRAVSIVGNTGIKVPLLGTVTAGQPILAYQNYEGYYTLPPEVFHGDSDDLFMLTVKGDSMIEAGIFNGDKVVVHKQSSADNGDIVVAMFSEDGIEEGATVKRFFRRSETCIVLHPENSTMSDFVLNDVTILGKVIGLIRSF